MGDESKTKEQLIQELTALRQRVAGMQSRLQLLEASEMSLREAEAQLQRHVEETTLLSRVTALTASAEDMAEALQQVCAELARFLQVSQSGFAVLKPGGVAAEVIADCHPPDSPSAMGVIIPVAGNPSMTYILEHKAPLAILDAQTDSLLAPIHGLMRQRNVQSILLVPIIVDGEVIGTLGLDAFQRREFSDSEIELVQQVANHVGQALKRKWAESQRDATLAALRESEEKFRNLAEQSPNMIFINQRGRVLYANRRCEEITGYTRDEFYAVDFDFLTLIAPEYRELITASFSRHMKGEEVAPYEYALITQDGKRVEVIITTRLIDYEGKKAILGIVTDITERIQAEEALRQYTAELEANNEALDAFAHTVAHDLKDPLARIVGFAELLLADHATMPDDALHHWLDTIAKNGRRMGSIIDELLLLATVRKVEEVEMEPLDMGGIVAEAQRRLTDWIDEYQATIVLPDDWPVALGYGPWVEEVWVNYLSNAIRYGGKPPHIELGADQLIGRPAIRFWVRDNGPGLTPEEQARLFTPFTQLDQVRARGYGLGLSIVRRIVEKLGGEVGIESESGRGSVFSFTLDLASFTP